MTGPPTEAFGGDNRGMFACCQICCQSAKNGWILPAQTAKMADEFARTSPMSDYRLSGRSCCGIPAIAT
jgi:hypothetical protein